jgi:hypothetical protein
MCIFNKLTFSDHANNATTTIIHSRLDDSLETGDPFCQKHKFSDPPSPCKAFSFLFPFFLHPAAAARRIQKSKCHSDERNADDTGPIIALGLCYGYSVRNPISGPGSEPRS